VGGCDAARLVEWFRATARELPWRGPFPRDPYRVLLSEVMAQQTQVERAAVAFVSFVARFPSVESLAAAAEEEVLAAFAGLGYYRRARLLHGAAQAVVALGAWPRGVAGLLALPGVGEYTARAVSAFAFGGGLPPVDGNVMRVAARALALELPLGSGPLARQAGTWAAALFAAADTPEVFEALMELGARLCRPAQAECPACPLLASCRAGKTGTWAQCPTIRPVRPRESFIWVALWARRPDGAVLLRLVEDGPILTGLWLPPFRQLGPGKEGPAAAAALAAEVGLAGPPLEAAAPVRHGITHRDIEVRPFLLDVGARAAEALPGLAWRPPGAPGLPTSSLLWKLARSVERKERGQ
jgi:A/G-specific adenine glycosylase